MKSSNSILITARDALNLLAHPADGFAWIDVRSEKEFHEGSIPRFQSAPILTDAERHRVGLAYKQQGPEAAIRLGHELVDPSRSARVAGWLELIQGSSRRVGIVACWRGGLRSQIACEWIQAAGGEVRRVEGGTKALRHELLARFENLPRIIVVSGMTGSGKTQFLRSLPAQQVIDLEALAHHRGSAFGGLGTQPAQASFENALGFALWPERSLCLVEDESTCIGSLHVPAPLREKMLEAELVILETPMSERVAAIIREYVSEPFERGVSREQLHQQLNAALTSIRRRLGGLRESEVRSNLDQAFHSNDLSAHGVWIQQLLEWYYDPQYLHGQETKKRAVAYRGDVKGCEQWIQSQFV